MSDVNCPYCNEAIVIHHEDGYGYEENEKHEQCCIHCNKTFAFTTQISYVYEAYEAPCLNGELHEYEETKTYPRCFRYLECKYCGDRREVEGIEKERERYMDTLFTP